ncbi:MAG: DUF1343 domain-containing protein [Gemmatimonadota bacterium]
MIHWRLGMIGWCLVAGCSRPVSAAQSARPGAAPVVRPGIEVLLTDSLALVAGKRVGLLTNSSGVDALGVSDVERLRAAGVHLIAAFSPEHGYRGSAAPGAAVASTVDSATGLPIYSLYGSNSAPSDTMLAGLDLILVDLQDAGARYFTYLATTVGVMRAAGKHGIKVLILDRPNPIAGAVEGNVLDTAFSSAVGLLAVPMRHGLTLGELALLARHDLAIHVDLAVVPVAGWRRSMDYDRVGLPFIPPSPNLKSVESLFHYPGTCLFEATALSVGRGSDAPFEQLGAPWLDTTSLLLTLRDAALPGVTFSSVKFTPRQPGDGKYADTLLAGIRLRISDRQSYDPVLTAVTILTILERQAPDRLNIDPRRFDRLAGGSELRQSILAGRAAGEIASGWNPALKQYRERRRPFLLYPE